MAAPPADLPLPHLPKEHPAQTYAALPRRELLQRMQEASRPGRDAMPQALFEAFYYLYFPYLRKVVHNALGFLHDPSGVEEVVNDALAAFFRTCGKFRLALATDDVGCDRLVRHYLGRLAKWKASHARSFQQSFGASALDDVELERRLNERAPAFSSESPSPEGKLHARVTQWMSTLRELDRDVLFTYFCDDHLGQKSDRLPTGIARRIAKKHRVKPDTLRQIKKKLLQQLRVITQSH